jgi:hypothetical protein
MEPFKHWLLKWMDMNENLKSKLDQIGALLSECEKIAEETQQGFEILLPNGEFLECELTRNGEAYWPEWYSSSC